MQFEFIVGNPPYQENIRTASEKSSLSKQLFPYFIMNTISYKPNYISLITPSRYFTGNSQDKSFIKLREFIKQNNHFKELHHYRNENDIFKGVNIAGGVSYFLYEKDFNGDVKFIEHNKGINNEVKRPLFEDGLDIIISMNPMVAILNKVRMAKDFKTITEKTFGRNAFGVVGKKSTLEKITSKEPFENAVKVFCAYGEIRYIEKNKIEKNMELIEKYKIFTSKGNGGAGIINNDKAVTILGKVYIGKPNSICTDSLIPIAPFNTKEEVVNLKKYMLTKFFRFMVGVLKTSQNIYQIVYKFVPLQNFTKDSDIDWSLPIIEIDQQLYKKYGLIKEEIDFIEEKIKPMKEE